MENKLRVWWVPQIPMESFYVPVDTPEEGKKVMDTLAAYDAFQLQTELSPIIATQVDCRCIIPKLKIGKIGI